MRGQQRRRSAWPIHLLGLVAVLGGLGAAIFLMMQMASSVDDAIEDRREFRDRPRAWQIVDGMLPQFKGWHRDERNVMTPRIRSALDEALEAQRWKFVAGKLTFGKDGRVTRGRFHFGGCAHYHYEPGYKPRAWFEPLNEDWYIEWADSCF